MRDFVLVPGEVVSSSLSPIGPPARMLCGETGQAADPVRLQRLQGLAALALGRGAGLLFRRGRRQCPGRGHRAEPVMSRWDGREFEESLVLEGARWMSGLLEGPFRQRSGPSPGTAARSPPRSGGSAWPSSGWVDPRQDEPVRSLESRLRRPRGGTQRGPACAMTRGRHIRTTSRDRRRGCLGALQFNVPDVVREGFDLQKGGREGTAVALASLPRVTCHSIAKGLARLE